MIARARATLAAAVLVGTFVVAAEFPLGQLIRGRGAVAEASAQLDRLQARNRALAAEVVSLHEDSTVARIAHADYGLVAKGERSLVILPSSSAAAGSGLLDTTTVPKSDLVPTDAIVTSSGSGNRPLRQAGFWSRLLQRLEFWKAVP